MKFFKLASVESVKTPCVCIVFLKQSWKKRINYLLKICNYLVSEKKIFFQVEKTSEKRLIDHWYFFLIYQIFRPLSKENVNIIQFYHLTNEKTNTHDFLIRSLYFIESAR